MSWHPSKTQSVTVWCEKCKKYITRSRIDGNCPFCGIKKGAKPLIKGGMAMYKLALFVVDGKIMKINHISLGFEMFNLEGEALSMFQAIEEE